MLRPSKSLCLCGNAMSQIAKQCKECRTRRITAKCECCGSEFQYKPSKPKRTCSGKCADRLRADASSSTQCRKVALICQSCGTSKQVSPSYATRKYCSTACASVGKSGANNHFWKGGITSAHQSFFASTEWKSICRIVWARDRRVCQRCGDIHEKGKRLHEVHHIASWAKFPELQRDIANLVLLCYGCHKFVHSRENELGEFIRNKH